MDDAWGNKLRVAMRMIKRRKGTRFEWNMKEEVCVRDMHQVFPFPSRAYYNQLSAQGIQGVNNMCRRGACEAGFPWIRQRWEKNKEYMCVLNAENTIWATKLHNPCFHLTSSFKFLSFSVHMPTLCKSVYVREKLRWIGSAVSNSHHTSHTWY